LLKMKATLALALVFAVGVLSQQAPPVKVDFYSESY